MGEYDKMDETLTLMTPVVEAYRDNLLRKWHLRFGHANMALIKQMSKDQVVNGMCLTKKDYEYNTDCFSCAMIKMKRISFNTHSERTNKPFRKLIVGICFMSHVNTFGEYTCYLAAIDEGTKYKWITLLRRKIEATDAVISLIKYIERQYEIQVKILSSDEDALFDCNKIRNYAKWE